MAKHEKRKPTKDAVIGYLVEFLIGLLLLIIDKVFD